MSNALAEFAVYVEDKFKLFIRKIKDEYNIPEETLLKILSHKDFSKLLLSRPIKSKKDNLEGECSAELKSGARKGEMCGKKISVKSETGKYCGTHVKLETISAVKEKQALDDIGGLVFRLNKWNNYTFGETGLILKSKTEKKVIGKQLTDGIILDLGPDDISICKRWKLKFIEKYSGKNTQDKEEIVENNTNTDANSNSNSITNTIKYTANMTLIS